MGNNAHKPKDNTMSADSYFDMLNTMASLFNQANNLRIESYYLSFDRYKSHKVAGLIAQAEQLELQAFEYMYIVDSIHR